MTEDFFNFPGAGGAYSAEGELKVAVLMYLKYSIKRNRPALSGFEKALYTTALELCGYNQTQAAKLVGVSRGTMRSKLKQFGVIA